MKRLIVIVVIAGFSGCTEDSTTSALTQFNSRVSGDVVVGRPVAFVLSNARGSIIVDGQVRDSTIGWFLDKLVTTSSQAEANDIFPLMVLQNMSANDTCYLTVSAPDYTAIIKCSVSLTLPYNVPCIIRKDVGALNVSNLQASLRAVEVNTVSITAHTGSCILKGSAGNIAAAVSLSASDSCIIETVEGDITLRIPDSTSATILVSTASGSIATSGLLITNAVQTPTSLSGAIGQGEATIRLRTTGGNITIDGF